MNRIFPWCGLFVLVLLGVGIIAGIVMEISGRRTFVGALIQKRTDVTFSHDERETIVTVDGDGEVCVITDGTDETIATRRYVLTFATDDGEGGVQQREIVAGSQSARVPLVRADQLALQRLNETAVEPGEYTHARIQRSYLVSVRGWLFDGRLLEITDLATINTEGSTP